jgi:hypothetical protein
MNARRLVLAVLVWLSALAASALSGAPVALAQSCPNEQLRTSFSAALPDCRAYELVSAPGVEPFSRSRAGWENYNGGNTQPGETFGIQAAVDGDRLALFSPYAQVGSVKEAPYYMLTRERGGWSTESIVPPQSTTNTGAICYNAYPPAYTPDLSNWILADGWEQGNSYPCAHDEPLLVAGEPLGFQNLFLRDGGLGSYQLIDVTPAGVTPADAWFQAGSEDLSRVVFDEAAKLTPEAPSGDNFYEWFGGVVRLVTILPDGTPVHGSLVNAGNSQIGFYSDAEAFTHAVSADGSRVFFTAGGDLYVREHAERAQSSLGAKGECVEPDKACTVQVDASQAGGAGGGGGGAFMWASADGSKVFFADGDPAGLTADTVPGSGQNLYQYDVDTGKLTDLTPAGEAGVLGVSGVGEDGSYVYFVAEGALSGAPNSLGENASAHRPNLYLAHGGAIAFIATLGVSPDDLDWEAIHPTGSRHLTARVSPNGLFIGFNSIRSLTGADNTDVNTGEPDQEIFLYDAAQNKLSCASCGSSGEPPTAPAHIIGPSIDLVAGGKGYATPMYLQRVVSNDGRVFFDTPNALLPRASNGQANVYEYQDGHVYLISSGTGGTPSYFLDASVSGEDVFIVSGQPLLPSSTRTLRIYDARVNGGLPEPQNLTECSEEDCKGAVTPVPLFAPPSSATFVGKGNPGPTVPPVKPKPKAKQPTRAQKLAKALRACRKEPTRKRAPCEKKARRADRSARGSKR